jgi:hypothetical protein
MWDLVLHVKERKWIDDALELTVQRNWINGDDVRGDCRNRRQVRKYVPSLSVPARFEQFGV